MPDQDSHPKPSARPEKRARTSTACDACRRRRAKCDGVKPVCGRCQHLGVSTGCVYDHQNDRRKPITKDVVQALTMKIEALEAELVQLKAEKSQGGAGTPLAVGSSSKPASTARDPVTDAFCGGLALNTHGELRYYGPTSSFRAILAESTESRLESARAWSLTRAPIPYAAPADPQLPRKPPLLSAELSTRLIRLAFEYCFSQFGLVDERAFLADLAKSATQRTANYSPFLLHVVLAIGCRYLDPNEDFPREICGDVNDPATRGDVFIDWARKSVDMEWFHPDISTVRALVGMSVYLAGQALDGPALMFAGQTMRLCEDFGMHLDVHRLSIGHGGISEHLRNARRDAFYAAFEHDVLLSSYIGRTPLFSTADIDQPLPTINNEIEFDSPAYRSSCFHVACKLIWIVSRLLETVYSPKPSISLATRQAAVPELHLALERWYHELPSPLRASTPTSSKAPHPHILGLNALYHQTVIMLHRPFFRRTGSDSPISVSTEKCLVSAKHIVRLIKLQRETHGLRFVAPFFQHTCFCSGTILALSATEDSISGTPERDAERMKQARIDLKTIVAALREIGTTWKTAHTSANVLEALLAQLGSAGSGNSTTSASIAQGPSSSAAGDAAAGGEIRPLELGGVPVLLPQGATEPQWQSPSAESLPHIFPSWDLESPGSLDDFLTLLNPATPSGGDFDRTFSFGRAEFGQTPPEPATHVQ
ncbi:hypothetical protein JCM1841_003502 [Sporobolomyces salmonicolor]